MRRLTLSLFVIIIAISPCYSQSKPAVKLIFKIENPSQDPSRLFSFVGCSQNKLVLHSKANNFVVYDFKSEKLSEFSKPNGLKRINPSSFLYYNDSIFLAFTKNIFFSTVGRINSLMAIPNRGEIVGMRRVKDRLVLLFFDRIRIVDIKGKTIDSLILPQKLRFAGIRGVSSPFTNCCLTTQSNLLMPYNRKCEKVASEFYNSNNAKLNHYGIRLFPADYFEGYIPKAASETHIYWHSVEEPYKILVTKIGNNEENSAIELDKNKINYTQVRPETIQVVEGSPGILDKESSIKMFCNSGRIYLMFRAPDLSTSVYFFDLTK